MITEADARKTLRAELDPLMSQVKDDIVGKLTLDSVEKAEYLKWRFKKFSEKTHQKLLLALLQLVPSVKFLDLLYTLLTLSLSQLNTRIMTQRSGKSQVSLSQADLTRIVTFSWDQEGRKETHLPSTPSLAGKEPV